MGLFNLFKKKKEPTLVNIDDLFAPTFNALSEVEKMNLIDKCLHTLTNGSYLYASLFYNEELRKEINPNKRKKYFEFIKNIKVKFEPKTAETIKKFLDDGTLDYSDLPEWLNDKQFYQYENDITSSNKIKMVIYLSNPKNLAKWGIKDFNISRLKNTDGTWKTYCEINELVDEIEMQIDENK